MSVSDDSSAVDLEDGSFRLKYTDLLNERLGGRAIACSDDWFAGCDNLVKPGRGVFKDGVFVATGQLMDGWESRRGFRRLDDNGNPHESDWCILRLGVGGSIKVLEIDTNHFRGNAPEQVSVQAAKIEGEPNKDTQWVTILDKSDVTPDHQNTFATTKSGFWTHLKLTIFPDGGVARFRAYGEVKVNSDHFIDGEFVDLASMKNGARGIAASDMFYSSPNNLLLPDRALNMGDGWETRRRRDEMNDWAIIKLGLTGTIRKVIIDTAFFKGNFPDHVSLDAINIEQSNSTLKPLESQSLDWQTVLPPTRVYADKEHLFIKQLEVKASDEFTHVRLNIFPDGGVSRLRVYGQPNWQSKNSSEPE